MVGGLRARAIHVGVDLAPDAAARAEDTVGRTAQICSRAGIADQRSLTGADATCDAVIDALRAAARELAHDGLLVLAFAGHTRRSDDAPPRWCLGDGELALDEVADLLAALPRAARVIVIAQTCSATAITRCLHGPQLAVVIASCRDDQATLQRAHSELVVRLERLLFLPDRRPSLAEVQRALEADMPDGERPDIWTNVGDWWSASALAIFTNTA